MFRTLLKHEWIAIKKMVGILCFAVFMSGILSGGVLRYMAWSSATGNGLMVQLYTIVLALALITIVGACTGTMYLMVYRFFKSRFKNEGYLTFTLPVTTHQQLLSSITGTTLSSLLVGTVACVSVLLGASIFLASFDAGTRKEMTDVLLQAVQLAGTNSRIISQFWLLNILELAVSFLSDMILLMLACTMAMLLARKHPVLMGITVYIGGDLLISGLSSAVDSLFSQSSTQRSPFSLIFSIGLYALVAVGGYFLMHRLMERKLNLA